MSVRRRDLLPGLALFAGTVLGALLGYAFFAVLGRSMSPDDLGAVGALVNLATILTVPGLGLQLVTARRVAAGRSGGADVADLVAAVVVGGVPTLVLAALAPVVVHLLHLSGAGSVLVVAASTIPMTLVCTGMGAVQGTERFGALSLVQFATGAVKFAAALVAAFLGVGVLGVVSWWAVGWVLLAAAVTWPAVALHVGSSSARGHASTEVPDAAPLDAPDAAPVDASLAGPVDASVAVSAEVPVEVPVETPVPASPPGSVWRRGWARARAGVVGSVPMAGLFVLSGLDLLLARHHLPRDASGVYTVGSLFSKVAFWGPQFLATFFYPRMARPDQRRSAILSALGATAGVGVLGVAVAAVAGGPLVRLVGGPSFVAGLGPLAWTFTALGVGLALVQVCVYADLARHGRAVGVAVWLTVAAVVAVVATWHATPATIVTGVASCVGVLVVVAVLLLRTTR